MVSKANGTTKTAAFQLSRPPNRERIGVPDADTSRGPTGRAVQAWRVSWCPAPRGLELRGMASHYPAQTSSHRVPSLAVMGLLLSAELRTITWDDSGTPLRRTPCTD